jgi:hypothetical protein
MPSPTRITVSLDPDQYVAVNEVAEDEGRTISELVREGLSMVLADRAGVRVQDTALEALKVHRMTNQDALEYVRERHGNRRTSLASIAWYRSKARKNDPDMPSDIEASMEKQKKAKKKKA